MKERAYSFGESGGLFGVFTEPDVPSDRPTVILLNAGLVHRVGPFRINVDLARRLAALGFSTLRMDLSGLGDSAPRPGEPDLHRRVLADLKDAMDFLAEKRGASRFVVGGICSGAINAHRAAVADPRVVGAIMLDGYAYSTPQFLLRRYGPRLADPGAALRFVGRQVSNLVTSPPAATPCEDDEILSQDFPPKERIAAELRQLMERNVALLFIYSGNWYLYFNYRDQIHDNFPDVPFGDRLTVEHFADADHTYTLLEDRERLFATMLGWMQERFG
jgi:pimeloyl-ACP methyl ester carboxylesterase